MVPKTEQHVREVEQNSHLCVDIQEAEISRKNWGGKIKSLSHNPSDPPRPEHLTADQLEASRIQSSFKRSTLECMRFWWQSTYKHRYRIHVYVLSLRPHSLLYHGHLVSLSCQVAKWTLSSSLDLITLPGNCSLIPRIYQSGFFIIHLCIWFNFVVF